MATDRERLSAAPIVLEAAPAAEPGLLQPLLGLGLERLRRRRGLSLEAAATACALTPSFLAAVEDGRSDIAIGKLARLLQVYESRLADLDPAVPADQTPIVRRGQGKHIRSAAGVDLFLLAPDTDRAMMPVTTSFAPRARLTSLHPHDGETFVYVLEGTLLLELPGRDPMILRSGDSAYYRPNPPPVMSNIGDDDVRVLGVVCPPLL